MGFWSKGKRQGFGDFFDKRGDRYIGYWAADLSEGKGTLISENGNQFKGTFKKGKKHGKGTMMLKNGVLYDEIWNAGILQVHEKRKLEGKQEKDAENAKMIREELKASEDWHRKLFTAFTNAKIKQDDHFSTLEELDTVNKVQELFFQNSNVEVWGKDEIEKFLEACRMSCYKEVFAKQQVDGFALLELSDQDLESSFRIKQVGHRINLITNVNHLKKLMNVNQEMSKTHENPTHRQGNSINSSSFDANLLAKSVYRENSIISKAGMAR